MSPFSWVIDTNVIVSGLLSPYPPPGRIIDAVLTGLLRICFDDRIEAEYRDVLSRSKFGISEALVEAFMGELRYQDLVTALPWEKPPPSDPDDQMFLEVAMFATDKTLVTGNQKHFPKSSRGGVRILSPREAWEELSRSS